MRPYVLTNIIFAVLVVLVLWLGWQGHASYWWLFLMGLIYIHALALGSVFIQWNFYVASRYKGKKDQRIALTFDDGPLPLTETILDILKAEKVPAAFFCIGKNMAAHPELLQRIVADGHVLGNHTYTHSFSFDWQSAATMKAELAKTNETAQQITGKKLRLFRPPYGVTNPNLAKAIAATGMQSIGWNLRSFDTKAKSEAALLKRLLRQLKGGDVILLHDTIPVTAAVLTSFIQEARKRGFIFAPLDEVLSVSPYA